jgi:hypothetical protein
MTCTDAYNYVTLEIVGGPPHVTATVRVGGAVCQSVSLDGCGTGSVRVKAAPSNPTVEIAIENLVLLTGHLPAAPDTDGNGA